MATCGPDLPASTHPPPPLLLLLIASLRHLIMHPHSQDILPCGKKHLHELQSQMECVYDPMLPEHLVLSTAVAEDGGHSVPGAILHCLYRLDS